MQRKTWNHSNLIVLCMGCMFALAAACTNPDGSQKPGPAPGHLPFADALQGALEQALEDGQGDYRLGISAAVNVPGYAPWAGAAGYSHDDVPMSSDMLLNAGSVAKTFEAVLALQLAGEGALDLDDSISTWLPEFEHVDGEITIRQLLNHTSGVYNVFEHPEFPWIGPDVEYGRHWELEEALDRFVLEPYGPPGHVQHYSSTNYLLLTAILENVLDEAVPDALKHRVLDPHALESSFITMGALPLAPFDVAHPWVDVDLDGDLEDLSGTPQTWIASLTHPVLFATPMDLAMWMDALFHRGEVLPDEMLMEMIRVPEVALPDPEGGLYGLGIIDFSQVLGVNVIGHGGSALGYSAAALYLPEMGISLAWAVNTGESPADLAERLNLMVWQSLYEVILSHAGPAKPR